MNLRKLNLGLFSNINQSQHEKYLAEMEIQ